AERRDDDLALARFVVLAPPPQSPATAKLTLAQLHSRSGTAALLLFPLVAAAIGLAIGSVDGLVCRMPGRALLGGGIGLLIGFIGGFLSSILANLAYAPLNKLALGQLASDTGGLSTLGFVLQMGGRSLAWCFAGMAMGLGQGIALRSKRLLLYGFIGGVVGGLLGGLFFDPI